MDKILGQEDYFGGYQEKIDALKEESQSVELDKMCYEAFNNEAGKVLLEYLAEKVVMASVPQSMGDAYANACIYYEGYREGYRQLIHAVKSYPVRREAEEKAKLRGAK